VFVQPGRQRATGRRRRDASEPSGASGHGRQKETRREDQARAMLERIGVPNVRKFSSAALAELTALIEKKSN